MKLINDTHLPSHYVHVNTNFDPSKGESLVFTKKRSKEGRYEVALVLDTNILTDEDKKLVETEVSNKIYKLFENVSPNKGVNFLPEGQAKLLQELNKLQRQYGYLTAINMIIARSQTDKAYIEQYREQDVLAAINNFTQITNF